MSATARAGDLAVAGTAPGDEGSFVGGCWKFILCLPCYGCLLASLQRRFRRMYHIDGTIYIDYSEGCCCPGLVVTRMEIEASRRRDPRSSQTTHWQDHEHEYNEFDTNSNTRQNLQGYKSHSAMSLPRGIIDASLSEKSPLSAVAKGRSGSGSHQTPTSTTTEQEHGIGEWKIPVRPALPTIPEMSRESSTVTLALPGPSLDIAAAHTVNSSKGAPGSSEKHDVERPQDKSQAKPSEKDDPEAKRYDESPVKPGVEQSQAKNLDKDDSESMTESIRQPKPLLCMGQKYSGLALKAWPVFSVDTNQQYAGGHAQEHSGLSLDGTSKVGGKGTLRERLLEHAKPGSIRSCLVDGGGGGGADDTMTTDSCDEVSSALTIPSSPDWGSAIDVQVGHEANRHAEADADGAASLGAEWAAVLESP
ncbi:hypothetical protein GMORB2_2634 [Geosmithia morbida]|uniref:Uncharacterized protein n=1 Tax=Geosmithia morbida TaxID=1094350 RepID=A0A9P5D1M8_9HYPO|nr:uncharacterized protein GMORB2_2634 [Geosmithia morbida]KAF4120631.1 hypothetical protein GMORB2_2634 [Geosmithia morbida]